MSTNGRLTVTWDEFMAEEAPSRPSLWGDALLLQAGGYTLIGGDTGVGKTIFMANLIIHLADARESFAGFPLPGRQVSSLLLEAEGNRYRFRDWIRHISKSLGIRRSLPIFFHERNAELAIEGPNLETMIAETKAEHVFLDTIGRFWVGSENDATEWRAGVTVPLAKLGIAYNVAFSFGDHYNKPNENRTGQHKVRGTPAKIQDCGATMRLEVGKGGDRSRVLIIDRVKDGSLPEPDRRALTVDLLAGTIDVDQTPETLEGINPTPDVRLAKVAAIVGEIEAKQGDASTGQIVIRLKDEFHVERAQAETFIKSTKDAGLIESVSRGHYRRPGGIA